MMALAMDANLSPMFATGAEYLQAEQCKAEAAHLNNIRRQLREMRRQAMPNIFGVGDLVLCREPPAAKEVEHPEGDGDRPGPFRRALVTKVEDGSIKVQFRRAQQDCSFIERFVQADSN